MGGKERREISKEKTGGELQRKEEDYDSGRRIRKGGMLEIKRERDPPLTPITPDSPLKTRHMLWGGRKNNYKQNKLNFDKVKINEGIKNGERKE